jgi:hypothetical protein
MARRKHRTINDLPLFADDEDLGEAVLGFERRREFSGLAKLLEKHGFPPISPLWKGRYVPAVKHYFDIEYGLIERKHVVKDQRSLENPAAFHARKPRTPKSPAVPEPPETPPKIQKRKLTPRTPPDAK